MHTFSSDHLPESDQPAIVFVYNTKAGLFNALAGLVNKAIAPATYACNLCVLTHGFVGMRSQWIRFLRRLRVPVEFLHRGEHGTASD